MPKYKKKNEENQIESESYIITNERINQLKSWLTNTKNYTKSGVFNRLHQDITAFINDRSQSTTAIDKLQTNLDTSSQENTELTGIINDSLDICNDILNNLEITEKANPDSLNARLNIIKRHTEISKFP